MDMGFKYEELQPICAESSYPYIARDGKCHASQCQPAIPAHGVTGYKDVEEDDEEALMDAVAQQPVSVAIEADQMAFQMYHKGVLKAECGTQLDHGVLVVGYGEEDGTKYWLVKNSWGASWGLHGYIKLARGVSAEGECGIAKQPSYPVVDGSVPPSPAPPGPGPGPSPSHYEKPPCASDEVQASIESLGGSVCAPPCDDGACPLDVPEGTTATPKCVLQSSSSEQKYCALECFLSSQCPDGAKCARQGIMGICVYADDGKAELKAALKLNVQDNPSEFTI